MKLDNFNWKIFVFVSIFAITSACSSDDDSPPPNTLTMDGEAFAVTTANILGVSLDGEGHVAITLVSTDLSNTQTLTIDFDYVVGESIEGDYAYPKSGDLRLLDNWLTNYVEFQGTSSTAGSNLEEGELTVIDNGDNNYTITMDLTMVDGKVFSGSYTGDFQVTFNNG
ncbi:MAG: hypothetical protein MI921_18520 [Cytophagales bacterium]|nr:hypothetical protein [Cytophagales bacterium]